MHMHIPVYACALRCMNICISSKKNAVSVTRNRKIRNLQELVKIVPATFVLDIKTSLLN